MIYGALVDVDPSPLQKLLDDGVVITAAEKAEAEDLFLASMLAAREHRDRRVEAFTVLMNGRKLDRPPDWDGLFDGLPDDTIARLEKIYPDMHPAMQDEFAAQFGVA